MTNGPEKSDPAIVAMKPTNDAELSAKEAVERRVGTKGNADARNTRRTQGRERVSQALARVRQAANTTLWRHLPEVGAVCGKAARTVLCGGREMKLASLPLQRREFIATIGAAAAWPLAVRAQQPAMPVVGFLATASSQSYTHVIAAFRQGLNEVGYIEGQNIAIEYRWAQNELDQLPALAAELVGRHVAVIATAGTPSTIAAKGATTTIPIVFAIASDPVSLGLVTNLNRPGGNVTGVTNLGWELAPKQLELLHELVPTTTSIALLINPTDRALAESVSRDAQAAVGKLGLQLHILNASAERDFDTAFAALTQLRAGALMIGLDQLFISRSGQLAALTVHHAIPASFGFREFAVAGGLMSYGGSITDTERLAGIYTGRILKGEKPADLPVQQSRKFELVINLKTAKALGLDIPANVLARADEVIE